MKNGSHLETNLEENLNISISDSAAARITKLLGDEPEGSRFRVAVDGGGCNGFQYKFVFDQEKKEDDFVISGHGVEVLIDEVSADLVKDSEINYVETLGFAHFEIKNPQAASSCGCGNSFSV